MNELGILAQAEGFQRVLVYVVNLHTHRTICKRFMMMQPVGIRRRLSEIGSIYGSLPAPALLMQDLDCELPLRMSSLECI